MASLFEAYITNLGKYNEGELVGETLKFPTTTEEVQALLKRIGVDGVRYEEFFITSFDGDVLGLYDYLTEYENLDELNYLACLLSELDQGELEKFEAVIDSGEHTSSVADLINLVQNLDCYEFYPGVEDDETLGRIYVEDMEAIDVPEHLLNYFDYEAYGRDIRLEEDGHFAPGGYVLNNGGQFIEHYHGIEDIPDEHKVFAFPQLTVREQMAAYSLYMSTLGNRPDLFPESAYVGKYITNPPADYDVPEEYLDDETFAAILGEAERYLGYPYVWGGSSPATSFDCSGFVSWVINHSGWNVGRLGAQGLYNICTPTSNPKPGDLVFFVGTYDTAGVSHCGIYVGDGMMIHCGDPIQYANLNTSYWQSHFYAYGRLP